MAQLSREQVRFGVVPGLARLGEVLVNALNRQADLNLRRDLAKIRAGAGSAKAAAAGPSDADIRRVRKDLERAVSGTQEASAIPMAPTGEFDPVTQQELTAPDFSLGEKLMSGFQGIQGALEEGMLQSADVMREAMTRLGSLQKTAMQEGNAPETLADLNDINSALTQGDLNPMTVESSGLADLLPLQHMLETNPGLVQELQPMLMNPELAKNNPQAQRLMAVAEQAGIDPASIHKVPQLVDQRHQVLRENQMMQQISDAPPVDRANFFLKQINPNARELSTYEVDSFRNAVTTGGILTQQWQAQEQAGRQIVEYARQLGFQGDNVVDASMTLVEAARAGDQNAAALLQARTQSEMGTHPAQAEQLYASYIAEAPSERNYLTWVRDTKGEQAYQKEMLNTINLATDIRGKVVTGLEKAQGRAEGGGVIANMSGFAGMLGGKQVEPAVDASLISRHIGRFKAAGAEDNLKLFKAAEGSLRDAGFNVIDQQLGAALVQSSGGLMPLSEVTKLLHSDKAQLIEKLSRLPQGEQFAIKRLMQVFGRTLSGNGDMSPVEFKLPPPPPKRGRRRGR